MVHAVTEHVSRCRQSCASAEYYSKDTRYDTPPIKLHYNDTGSTVYFQIVYCPDFISLLRADMHDLQCDYLAHLRLCRTSNRPRPLK